jgi:dTMP kinase
LASPGGRLITLEGPEGAGKSTQAAALRGWLEETGRRVRLFAEPGSTRISEAVRAILLSMEHTEMSPRAELFLFLAARAQLVHQELRPALQAGEVVVCDRYTDSTLAYQGVGSGLPLAELERLNDLATDRLRPDLTLLLDLDVNLGLARQSRKTRMEEKAIEFHRAVREAYLALARRWPERILVVDASRPAEAVAAEIRAAVEERLS